MWKFQIFLPLRFLREITFSKLRFSKPTSLTVLEILIFNFTRFQPWKKEKRFYIFPKLISRKIWMPEKFLKFPHCAREIFMHWSLSIQFLLSTRILRQNMSASSSNRHGHCFSKHEVGRRSSFLKNNHFSNFFSRKVKSIHFDIQLFRQERSLLREKEIKNESLNP